MVARHDQVTSPEILADLAVARLGQAYFSRRLNELDDREFSAPSLLPGWTRAHVVAHVGYNARALTRLAEWADTGVETPMYESREARDEEIELGATLAVRALRHLSEHAAITLDVSWRDLPDDVWSTPVRSLTGATFPVSRTVWMRSREVWLHAVDLGNGGRFADLPAEVARRMLGDIVKEWSRRTDGVPGFRLLSTDTGEEFASTGAGCVEVKGSLHGLVAWASGRRDRLDGVLTPPAPRWM